MIVCLGTTPTLQRTMAFAKLTVDGVNRATSVREYASGKSTNVARVLRTLGNDVLATGFLGGDSGKTFRADLEVAGIAHEFADVGPSTRLCLTLIDQSAGTATELIEESKTLTVGDYDALLHLFSRLLQRAEILVISGTLPPHASADFYAQCVALAGRRVRVILDAVGQPLLEALAAKPFVIKPNQSEVARTLSIEIDSDSALRDAMKTFAARGASWVVVTRGAKDTIITNGHSFWQIHTPSVKVVSAIGSGDSFAAGLASGLAAGQDVPQACVLGAACGSANAMTPDAGHVRREDVDHLIATSRPFAADA